MKDFFNFFFFEFCAILDTGFFCFAKFNLQLEYKILF